MSSKSKFVDGEAKRRKRGEDGSDEEPDDYASGSDSDASGSDGSDDSRVVSDGASVGYEAGGGSEHEGDARAAATVAIRKRKREEARAKAAATDDTALAAAVRARREQQAAAPPPPPSAPLDVKVLPKATVAVSSSAWSAAVGAIALPPPRAAAPAAAAAAAAPKPPIAAAAPKLPIAGVRNPAPPPTAPAAPKAAAKAVATPAAPKAAAPVGAVAAAAAAAAPKPTVPMPPTAAAAAVAAAMTAASAAAASAAASAPAVPRGGKAAVGALAKKGAPPSAADERPFVFRLGTNGKTLLRFIEPICAIVKTLRLVVSKTPAFSGLRVETSNPRNSMLIKSRYACTVSVGHGVQLADVQGAVLRVDREHFKDALKAAVMADAPLTLTKYSGASDTLTMEAVSATNDARVEATLPQVVRGGVGGQGDDDESTEEELMDVEAELGFHSRMPLDQLTAIAKGADSGGARQLSFTVKQAVALDPDDGAEVTYWELALEYKGDAVQVVRKFHTACTESTEGGGGVEEPEDADGGASLAPTAATGMRIIRVRAFNLTDSACRALPWKAPYTLTVAAEQLRGFLASQSAADVELHLPAAPSDDQVLMLKIKYGDSSRHTVIFASMMEDAAMEA